MPVRASHKHAVTIAAENVRHGAAIVFYGCLYKSVPSSLAYCSLSAAGLEGWTEAASAVFGRRSAVHKELKGVQRGEFFMPAGFYTLD